MREKITAIEKKNSSWISGYFKPDKAEKRIIHKKVRRIKDLDISKKGIYNRIGVHWEWS